MALSAEGGQAKEQILRQDRGKLDAGSKNSKIDRTIKHVRNSIGGVAVPTEKASGLSISEPVSKAPTIGPHDGV